MAGNAREWTRSAFTGDFRYALGGSYAEVGYTFNDFWVHRAGERDPHLGIRCAKYISPLPEDQTRPVAAPFRDYRAEQPASDEQYRVIASLYGKFDYYFPVSTSQAPMFKWIGTTRKHHLQYESGHIPSEREDFARQIVAWLDEHLGAVTLR